LADPHLSGDERTELAGSVRRHCRRLLRLLGSPEDGSELPERPATRPRPRVLVAEDCPDSRQAVCSFLTRAGLDVTPAENGRVAVALARAGSFDLVLLDMQMPEVDGYEAARQLRRDGYRGPVVALTGDVQPGDEQACHEAGCDTYLAKPWDPDHLLRVLEGHVKLSRQRPRKEPVKTAASADPSLRELAREFASGLPRAIADMAAALSAGNRNQLGSLAHQASGAAGIFGFTDLSRAARQLEDAARDGGEDERGLAARVQWMEELTRKILRDPGGAD
jgi:CheY-like chemotaxis protein/HPt (histidine-containing phosphotransfer) domain-containing protein